VLFCPSKRQERTNESFNAPGVMTRGFLIVATGLPVHESPM
jgi:hypothetical protein